MDKIKKTTLKKYLEQRLAEAPFFAKMNQVPKHLDILYAKKISVADSDPDPLSKKRPLKIIIFRCIKLSKVQIASKIFLYL